MPTLSSVRRQLRAAVQSGENEEAMALVERIQEHYPGDVGTIELLGRIHLEAGRPWEGQIAFESVLKVDPESVLARAGLALALEQQGDLDGALEQAKRAFDLDSSNAGVAAEVRRLQSQLGRARPADAGSAEHRASRRLLRDGRYQEAVPLLDVAREMAPREEVVVGLATALWLAGRRMEAEETARALLADRPRCLKALAIAAGAAFSRGDQEALALLDQASACDPGYVVARRLFEAGGLAFPELEREPRLPGEEPAGALPESGAVGAEERRTEAFEAVVVEASRGPTRPGRAADEGGRPAELKFDAEEVATLRSPRATTPSARRGDAALHISFALHYGRRGHVEMALDEWRRALRLDPGTATEIRASVLPMAEADPANPRLRWLVGDTLAAEGCLEQAMEQYLMVLRGQTR